MDKNPKCWKKQFSNRKNRSYYINLEKGLSQWENPSIPRPLKWIANSCYLDTALFCLFAGPKDFINDMLYTDLDKRKKEIEKNGTLRFCGNPLNTDITNRKEVQKQLRYIAESITGKSDKIVEYCTDFRKSLIHCRGIPCKGEEEYHTGSEADSGEFLRYLFKVLPVKRATKKIITYGSNDNKPLFNTKSTEISSIEGTASVVHIVSIFELLDLPESGVNISDLIIEKNDSGIIEDEEYWKSEFNGKKYKRCIKITSIVDSPIIIVNIRRLITEELGGRKELCHTPVYPDEYITTSNGQKFVFYAVIVHNGRCHYTCIAKYGKIWYYYDDVPYGKGVPLRKFNSFQDAIGKIINPFTNGTQYFYKPIF
jgi:ubiquitin C-terminal hydrolase